MIEERLECDVEELADMRDRSGVIGYFRSALDAVTGSLTRLKLTVNDPSQYDLVVIGTPIWMWHVSTPVLTYLTENNRRLKNVAFFLTYLTSGSGRVSRQMADICDGQPVATLALHSFLVNHSEHRLRRFVKTIDHFLLQLSTEKAPPVTRG